MWRRRRRPAENTVFFSIYVCVYSERRRQSDFIRTAFISRHERALRRRRSSFSSVRAHTATRAASPGVPDGRLKFRLKAANYARADTHHGVCVFAVSRFPGSSPPPPSPFRPLAISREREPRPQSTPTCVSRREGSSELACVLLLALVWEKRAKNSTLDLHDFAGECAKCFLFGVGVEGKCKDLFFPRHICQRFFGSSLYA